MPDDSRPAKAPTPLSYRLARALARLWFNFYFHRIRLLGGDSDSSLALFAVNHPASLLDSIILIASFERPLRCLLPRKLLRGPVAQILAAWFRLVPWDEEDGEEQAIAACLGALEEGETVMVFANPFPPRTGGLRGHHAMAAKLAVEAESRLAGPAEVSPVDLFLPVGRSQLAELLIYRDAPLIPREYVSRFGGDKEQAARALTLDLEPEGRERTNVFALSADQLRQLLSNLEQTLRSHLADEWATQTNWKQRPEELDLSGLVCDWAESANRLNPGRLVALGERLEDCRERHRRWSLDKFEIETAGGWMHSSWPRTLAWMETVIGFAPALYGVVNHLLAGTILWATGMNHHREGRDSKAEWIVRGAILVGCYAAQIFFCYRLLGRAGAGYYALTLPVSGAYVWRYFRLMRRRTRLLWKEARAERKLAGVKRARAALASDLRHSLEPYAKALGLPY